jgi:ABC-2 type transport system permease protein
MIGSIGLPVVLMIIFGELPSFHQHISVLGGLPLFDTYVPIIMVLGLTMLTLLGLPGPLVSYRELGILRRLSTTPVPRPGCSPRRSSSSCASRWPAWPS